MAVLRTLFQEAPLSFPALESIFLSDNQVSVSLCLSAFTGAAAVPFPSFHMFAIIELSPPLHTHTLANCCPDLVFYVALLSHYAHSHSPPSSLAT